MAIREKINKLVRAEFIREVKYTHLAGNSVIVKKPSGKSRMCVEYTNLNNACPKDAYPLPSIDSVVNGEFGYKSLSFVDTYSRYNQIRKSPMDVEKTTFMTG